MLLAFSKSNDSPCFVKIAIFRQKSRTAHPGGPAFVYVGFEPTCHPRAVPVRSTGSEWGHPRAKRRLRRMTERISCLRSRQKQVYHKDDDRKKGARPVEKRKGRKGMTVLIVLLCILALLLIAFAFWLPSYVMTGSRQTLEEAFAWQSDHYDTSFYADLKKTDYVVNGFEDYTLHVELLENPAPTANYIILSHGYTDNRMGSLKYVPMYLKLGFNCIVYDLRGHGENAPDFTTYGIREAKDLKCLIDDTRARYPDLAVLGLHGESLGAATTITCLQYQPAVDFAVADCGFSDIENVLRNGYRNAHMPVFLVDVADFTGKLRYHYSLKEMRPIDSLDENTIPILFVHGADDQFILPKNSEDMAARTKGPSALCLIPGAGHAASILTDPDAYQEAVAAFLNAQIR